MSLCFSDRSSQFASKTTRKRIRGKKKTQMKITEILKRISKQALIQNQGRIIRPKVLTGKFQSRTIQT